MNTTVRITSAEEADRKWVADTMQESLQAFYGGDHRAHAKRIFDAHIKGGKDLVGFFSEEQKTFIARSESKRVGMVHVVGKKQSTYKISPLIVDPNHRGKYGLGSRLLQHAENYARKQGARQIYCTVAEQNLSAMQFFLRKGFIRAGSSTSHYKEGITEHMLYKPVYKDKEINRMDEFHISVLPLETAGDSARLEMRKLLLEKLPDAFEGIDDDWVDSLLKGYDRRHTQDVNAKYKLIYVAMDGDRGVVGVAGATPKKGSPIKVMPFISTTDAAFEALLIDLPHQLAEYGHKLYIHCDPTPNQVVLLQRLGWSINALMPSAYRPDVVTQQWSSDVSVKTIRALRIKDQFFNLIDTGEKDLEVRVGYDTIKKIVVGERIKLFAHTQELEVKVVDIRKYESFLEMLKHEDYQRIAPNSKSEEETYDLLRKFYPLKKENLGVYVMQFERSCEPAIYSIS